MVDNPTSVLFVQHKDPSKSHFVPLYGDDSPEEVMITMLGGDEVEAVSVFICTYAAVKRHTDEAIH